MSIFFSSHGKPGLSRVIDGKKNNADFSVNGVDECPDFYVPMIYAVTFDRP